ncbi:hypothetical protein QN361_25100, partial [Pseudomonas sp. 5C2]|nr:hypothetical protein [Pseudomonas sp. 5C2]
MCLRVSFCLFYCGSLCLLLSVCSVFLLLGLGDIVLWGAECRCANIALQNIQTGNYIDPYHKGAPYNDKPLPTYWKINATA